MENKENNVLIGVILGTLATIGIVAGTYIAYKKDLIALPKKKKYFDWKKLSFED